MTGNQELLLDAIRRRDEKAEIIVDYAFTPEWPVSDSCIVRAMDRRYLLNRLAAARAESGEDVREAIRRAYQAGEAAARAESDALREALEAVLSHWNGQETAVLVHWDTLQKVRAALKSPAAPEREP